MSYSKNESTTTYRERVPYLSSVTPAGPGDQCVDVSSFTVPEWEADYRQCCKTILKKETYQKRKEVK